LEKVKINIFYCGEITRFYVLDELDIAKNTEPDSKARRQILRIRESLLVATENWKGFPPLTLLEANGADIAGPGPRLYRAGRISRPFPAKEGRVIKRQSNIQLILYRDCNCSKYITELIPKSSLR
jgi:hypothetical protein